MADPILVMRLEAAIAGKLGALPGVRSVGITTAVPMDGSNSFDPIFAADRTYAAGQVPPLRRFVDVSPGYFQTLGIPLIAGRDFTWSDVFGKVPVAMISANFAREYWGTPANAVGKQIRADAIDPWRQIIGVVGDVHDHGVDQPAPTQVYWPLLADKLESPGLVVRRYVAFAIRSPRAGSRSLLREVRGAVWSVDASLPLSRVHTLAYFYRDSTARASFTLVMLGIAGAMALLLGAVGLYGVLAYAVSQRTREIGIRLALGAQPRALVGLFVRQGLWLTAIGVVCGLLVALGAMRLMSSLLYGVSPVDPLTYAVVIAGLTATALLASYLPSRRAAAVDPVEALRAE